MKRVTTTVRDRRPDVPRRSGLALLLPALATACAGGSPAAADAFRVVPAAIVAPGEPAGIEATTDARRIVWSVRDHLGRAVADGEAIPADGRARIGLPPVGRGYFEVTLAADGRPPERRALAVVTPHARPGGRFGVMTHFAQGWGLGVVPLVRRLGVRHVRDELYWEHVEPEPGVFRVPEAYAAYMAALKAAEIEPLLVLSFENEHYDGGETPHTDEGRRAFARYADAMLDRFGGQVPAVEVWNEVNGSWCTGPCAKDRPGTYAPLLAEVHRTVKREHPGTTVLGGAAVLIPLPFYADLFERGALDVTDGVVIHPYRTRPEGLVDEVEDLRDLMRAHGGPVRPIWATEAGRLFEGEAGRVDLARYLVKTVSLLLAADVERVYWYLMRDMPKFAGMGLVRAPGDPLGDLAPTPAFAAYAVLIRQLDGARYLGRAPSDPRTHVHAFRNGGEERRVVWATDEGASLRVTAPRGARVVDLMGNVRPLPPSLEPVLLPLGPTPFYLDGPATIDEERADELLTDAELDFRTEQGARGWRYGHASAAAGRPAEPSFSPLELKSDTFRTFWGLESSRSLAIDRTSLHPTTRDGAPVWAIRRWVSPAAGRVTVSGRVERADERGDGTGFRVFVDGEERLREVVGGEGRPTERGFALEAELRPGSTVDFIAAPGPGGGVDFDSLSLGAAVTRPRAP